MVKIWLEGLVPLAMISTVAPSTVGSPITVLGELNSLPTALTFLLVTSTPGSGSLTEKLFPKMVWSAVYASVPRSAPSATATTIPFTSRFVIVRLPLPRCPKRLQARGPDTVGSRLVFSHVLCCQGFSGVKSREKALTSSGERAGRRMPAKSSPTCVGRGQPNDGFGRGNRPVTGFETPPRML